MTRRSPTWEWSSPASKPRAADGIRARSTRGTIGETWWSRRFVDLLESFNIGARLQRGKAYARGGQVLDVNVQSGVVTAHVQGSRLRPYKITITLATLTSQQWTHVEKAMAERAVILARLLACEMPIEIETVFDSIAIPLFPKSRKDLSWECSCPDWGDPCKHVAAVLLILAESFDHDPFLVLHWRGRSRDEILTALRLHRGIPSDETSGSRETSNIWPELTQRPPPHRALNTFWTAPFSFEKSDSHLRSPTSADALLLQVNTDITWKGTSLIQILVPAYAEMSEQMQQLLNGSIGTRNTIHASKVQKPRLPRKRTKH